MRFAILTLVAATAMSCAPAYAQAPNMREGLWEITTQMEMTGKEGAQMPRQTVKHCMTKQDVSDPRRTTPGGKERDSKCKMTDYKMQGNTATWKMACEGEGAMTGTGSITYAGDSYTGNQTMSMNRSGQVMNMKMSYSGKRLGDCPPKQK